MPPAAAAALPMVPTDPDAHLEGWLKKRGTRIPGHWSERYFVLKDDRLMYYLKPTDGVARGAYVLDRTCVVSEVKPYTTSYDKKKALHAFRIMWPEAVEMMEGPPVVAGESNISSSSTSTTTTSSKDGESKRGSGRFAGPSSASTSSKVESSSSSTNTTGNNAVTGGAQMVDVNMDPYVMSSYQAPAHQQQQQQASTKIVRSASSLSEGSGSLHRLGSQGSTSFSGGGGSQRGGGSSSSSSSSSGTATLATGGAMVAMAVGGVVVGAMTAGLGLVAPMVIVGLTAATGSGAAVYGAASSSSFSHGGLKTKQVALVLALDSKDSAEEWRAAIEAQIRMSQRFPQSRWMSMVGLDRRMPRSLGGGSSSSSSKQRGVPRAAGMLEDVDRWTRATRWRPWGVYNGMRVYELDQVTTRTGVVKRPPASTSTAALKSGSSSSSKGGLGTWGKAAKASLPCRKVQVAVRGTPLEAFIALISVPCRVLNGVVESVRNVERLDDQSDVIHLTLKPLFLWPTWTAPRDFCLLRSWRYDEDGTYIICYDSTTHRACPPMPGYVRGAMHAVYTISPKRHLRGGAGAVEFDEAPECLLTHILQVDPKGWVWHQLGYLDAFVTEMLCQVLDVRDLLETDRFMAVHVDTSGGGGVGGGVGARGKGKGNGTGKGENGEAEGGASAGEGSGNGERGSGTLVTHRATVPADMWGDVDATSFVVRGPNYSVSKLKVPSEPAAFRLLAVDLFDLPEAQENIAGHKNNRVQAAMAAGDCPPFVFVVQLQIPGVDQQLGYVSYFAPPDMALLEEDTPLSRVLKPFFFGSDDGYRDLRFKLIPKIVEGNWVVRKSVGSTPAILGTKLKQTYHRGTNYFELDVNIASSSVAAGVVRLAAGYAKTLVVDLALVIQGETEDELPERVVAGWRINNMDLATAKRME